MKQFTIFILTLFAFCSISAQTNNFYLTKNAIGKTFFANEIDSITYNDIGDTFVEQIWSKGLAYETKLSSNDTLSVKGSDDIECVSINNDSVLGGFIANTGDFLILMPSNSSSGDLHLAIGNVYNNEAKNLKSCCNTQKDMACTCCKQRHNKFSVNKEEKNTKHNRH